MNRAGVQSSKSISSSHSGAAFSSTIHSTSAREEPACGVAAHQEERHLAVRARPHRPPRDVADPTTGPVRLRKSPCRTG